MANGFTIDGDKFQLVIDDWSVGVTEEFTQSSSRGRNKGGFNSMGLYPSDEGTAKMRTGIYSVSGAVTAPPAAPDHLNTYFHAYTGVEKDSTYTYPEYSVFGCTATNLSVLNRTGTFDLGTFASSGLSASFRIWSNPASVDDVQVFTTYEQRDSGTATAGTPGCCWMYGGARMSSTYSTGSAAVTVGSATVAGSGTTWTSSMVGGFFTMTGDSAGKKAAYRVIRVISATSLVLDRAYNGDSSTSAYGIAPYSRLFAGNGSSHGWVANDGYAVGAKCATSAWGRVVLGGPVYGWGDTAANAGRDYHPFRIQWSGRAGSTQSTSSAHTGIHAWDADGYIDLPAAGGHIIQMFFHDDRLLILREFGLTILVGSPQFDGEGSLSTSQEVNHLAWPIAESYCSANYCSAIASDLYIFALRNGLFRFSGGSLEYIYSPFDKEVFTGAKRFQLACDSERVSIINPGSSTSGNNWYVYHTRFNCWTDSSTSGTAASIGSIQQVRNGKDYDSSGLNKGRGTRVYGFSGSNVVDLTDPYSSHPFKQSYSDWYGGTRTDAFTTNVFDLGGITVRPKLMTIFTNSTNSQTITCTSGYGSTHTPIAATKTVPTGYTGDDPVTCQLRLVGRRTNNLQVSASITPTSSVFTWPGIRRVVIEGTVVGGIRQLSTSGAGMAGH